MLPFTLQQLRILKAVGTEKNFTRAAEFLYLSQPSLSKQIKILEKNIGILLVNRKNNKICLTENGKIFSHYSERILSLCEESCRTFIDLKNGERGNLIIGASQTFGTYLMLQILTLFTRSYPQIDLKILINSTRIIKKNVLNEEINIAIVESQISNNFQENLSIKNFVEDEFSLIISRFHPLATKKKINEEDLYYLNFITLKSNSNLKKLIYDRLVQNQIKIRKLKIIMKLNSIEGITTAVSLGLGAAFILSSTLGKEIEFQTIKILNIKNIRMNRTFYLISTPNRYKSNLFKIFCHELGKLKIKR